MKYLLMLLLFIGCSNSNVTAKEDRHGLPESMGRFVDAETNITCYVYYTHAISCVKN